MNKISLATLFFILSIGYCLAQQPDLITVNESFLDKQQKSMIVLGSWALGNVVLGSIYTSGSTGSQRYFHQMNMGWNAVNLGIAAFGYYQAFRTDPSSWELAESIRQNYSLEKILLLNSGLDLAYMASGVWMMEKAKNTSKNPERWKGFGQSLILQGAFLLVFDLATFAIHSADNHNLDNLIGQLHFSGSALQLSLKF